MNKKLQALTVLLFYSKVTDKFPPPTNILTNKKSQETYFKRFENFPGAALEFPEDCIFTKTGYRVYRITSVVDAVLEINRSFTKQKQSRAIHSVISHVLDEEFRSKDIYGVYDKDRNLIQIRIYKDCRHFFTASADLDSHEVSRINTALQNTVQVKTFHKQIDDWLDETHLIYRELCSWGVAHRKDVTYYIQDPETFETIKVSGVASKRKADLAGGYPSGYWRRRWATPKPGYQEAQETLAQLKELHNRWSQNPTTWQLMKLAKQSKTT